MSTRYTVLNTFSQGKKSSVYNLYFRIFAPIGAWVYKYIR